MPARLYQSERIDFVEVTPETLCRQRAIGNAVAIEIVPEQLAQARDTCRAIPMVVHGVELSIGSAHGWNTAYLEMLDCFQASWPFLWHSEHLGFQTISGDHGETLEVGVPLPVPPTREAVDLVAERSALIRKRYGVPFLLENPAYYISGIPADPEIADDIGLIGAIMDRGDCSLLLDLHNIHCNAINHGFDPYELLERVPMERVLEIHVAGGSERDGFWMDAHNNRVADRVWDLLEYTLPRAPNLGGIVFEMLDEFAPRLGVDAISEELDRVRDIWNRRRLN